MPLIDWILLRRQIDPETDCWEWPGARTHFGYGLVRLPKSHVVVVHRYVYGVMVAPVPDDLKVCHTCDNPPCCNPAHLFLGTQSDNMRDCSAKDRLSRKYRDDHWTRKHGKGLHRGSQHHSALLTEVDIPAIRADPRSCAKVGADYGVAGPTIDSIRSRRSWKHVP